MSDALPATTAAALTADLGEALPGAFLAHGLDKGGDLDAAFDDAVDQAGYDYGFAGLIPSIAAMDAEHVTPVLEVPVTLERAALLAVRALHAGGLEPGTTYAIPVCPDSAVKRRRVRVTLLDPQLAVAEVAGRLGHVTPQLEATLRDHADNLLDDEQFERVDVVTARPRYRPVVTAFTGATKAEFAVLDPTGQRLVSGGHRTAGEARRAAVDLVKQGAVAGSPTGSLEVVKVSRRADGNPFSRIARVRVSTRLVLKLTVGALKDPTKVKTTGWVFYGTSASAAAHADQAEAAAETTPTATTE